jgi:aspartyl-tRNA synthetase
MKVTMGRRGMEADHGHPAPASEASGRWSGTDLSVRRVEQKPCRPKGRVERLVQRRHDYGTVMFINSVTGPGLSRWFSMPSAMPVAHQGAHALRSECVVSVNGQVTARPEESKNPNLPNG